MGETMKYVIELTRLGYEISFSYESLRGHPAVRVEMNWRDDRLVHFLSYPEITDARADVMKLKLEAMVMEMRKYRTQLGLKAP